MSPVHEGGDAVDHPPHYNADPSGVECIDIVRHRNFNVGNAIKYLWRNGLKDSDSSVQDLKKAIWYIEDEIERLDAVTNATLEPPTPEEREELDSLGSSNA